MVEQKKQEQTISHFRKILQNKVHSAQSLLLLPFSISITLNLYNLTMIPFRKMSNKDVPEKQKH
jgi:hypothetical protein